MLLTVICPVSILAQTWSGVVVEEATGQPLADALLFVANSERGTYTDADGRFTLSLEGFAEESEVVVSFVGYATQIIKIQGPLPSLIELRAISTQMDDVLIQGQKSNKRKGWIQQFERALFGSKKNRMTWYNPESILFWEEGDTLVARSTNLLVLQNQYLGYDIRFLLETFRLAPDQSLILNGKVFFQDLPETTGSQKRRRQRMYEASKAYFFSRLMNGTLPDTYAMGLSVLDDQGRILSVSPIDRTDLDIRTGQFSDTLWLAGKALTVQDLTHWTARTFRGPGKEATAYLRSRSGYILFDKASRITNGRELEEYGYWTEQRLAEQVPGNFAFTPRITDTTATSTARNWSASLSENYQERVYIQPNKSYYSLRDTLWFQVFLAEAQNLTPSTHSKVVHVQLIHAADTLADSLDLHKDIGLSGHFDLQKLPGPGVYRLRAFTNYQRNSGDSLLYERPVWVFDYSRPELGLPDTTFQTFNVASPARPLLQFFPEGGPLIAGMPATVAFELTDSLGNPLSFRGVVVDQAEQPVTSFEPVHLGMGVFRFTPQADQLYEVRLQLPGRTFSYPLPAILSEGLTLSASNLDTELALEVKATRQDQIAGAFLIGRARGQLFYLENDLTALPQIRLPKTECPPGLLQFILFDRAGNPTAERLLYNDHLGHDTLTVQTGSSIYGFRQKVNLSISLPDTLGSSASRLAVSVTDAVLAPQQTDGKSIQSEWLLQANLDCPVPQAGLIIDRMQSSDRYLIDLALLVRGWRRFTDPDSLSDPMTSGSYLVEVGPGINGVTQKPNKKQSAVKSDILVTTVSEPFWATWITSDSSGHFSLPNLPFQAPTHLMLQAQRHNEKQGDPAEEFTIDGNTNLQIRIQEDRGPTLLAAESLYARLPQKRPPIAGELPAYEQRRATADSMFAQELSYELSEVTIKAQRAPDPRLYDVFNLEELDWVPEQVPARQVLNTLKPGNVYKRDMLTGEFGYRVLDVLSGDYIYIPVVFFINGFRSTYASFESLTTDVISFIGIQENIITIYTRPGGSRLDQPEPNRARWFFPGYHYPRAFYSPAYPVNQEPSTTPDLRTAIYWQGDLTADEQGQINLHFYTADTPGRYQIHIEGHDGSGRLYNQTRWITVSRTRAKATDGK
jgi:hypothetical protein